MKTVAAVDSFQYLFPLQILARYHFVVLSRWLMDQQTRVAHRPAVTHIFHTASINSKHSQHSITTCLYLPSHYHSSSIKQALELSRVYFLFWHDCITDKLYIK